MNGTPPTNEYTKIYALLGRIRMRASTLVIEAAESLTREAVAVHKNEKQPANQQEQGEEKENQQITFSKACRIELDALVKDGLTRR